MSRKFDASSSRGGGRGGYSRGGSSRGGSSRASNYEITKNRNAAAKYNLISPEEALKFVPVTLDDIGLPGGIYDFTDGAYGEPGVRSPLDRTWAFWAVGGPKQPVVHTTIVVDELAAFMMLASKSCGSLKLGCSFYMFEHGVIPSWEDPHNAGSGRWTLSINDEPDGSNSRLIQEIWTSFMYAAAGGAEPFGRQISGVVYARAIAPHAAYSYYRISVWLKGASAPDGRAATPDDVMTIGQKLADVVRNEYTRCEVSPPAGPVIYYQLLKASHDEYMHGL